MSVEAMVQETANQAEAKKLHPFFAREPEAALNTPLACTSSTGSAQPRDSRDPEFGASTESRKRQGGNSSERQHVPDPKKQRLDVRGTQNNVQASITKHFAKPFQPEHVHTPLPERAFTSPLGDMPSNINKLSPANTPTDTVQIKSAASADSLGVSAHNSKVIRFNPKTGTLGSPPKAPQSKPPSRIVTIKYNQQDGNKRAELGQRITQILEQPPKPAKRGQGRPSRASKDTAKGKHPLFSRKTNPAPNDTKSTEHKTAPPQKRQTISMVTPKSPRKQRNPFAQPKVVNFGSTKPVGTRVPGAMHPAWPSHGMAHVRGDEFETRQLEEGWWTRQKSKKSKSQVVTINPMDVVYDCTMAQLHMESYWENAPRPPELRLPKRRFQSGRKLQKEIRPQLRTLTGYPGPVQDDPDLDELAGPTPRSTHPAVAHLFRMLETNLSAYDRSTCETCTWAQKYAPTNSDQVLQAGKEAIYLRHWLETLKVQSVEVGGGEGGKAKDKADKAPRKRRKNKLDGFVVDSDEEEEDDLDEVAEEETDWSPAGSAFRPKTVIRTNCRKNAGRLPNTVVISGPHGSGKTAAVYAVAKELGFEVFEINSGSRRSGKDLLERVGDMTRNHLVQRHQADGSTDTEQGTDDETANDVKSGKQGMMTAFFKPKTDTGTRKPTAKKGLSTKEDVKQAPKAQKQSLILLEEADVLYEEDKQFWTTLVGMMAQSKRPFIITCNDENFIPIQNLNLYGILRFSPSPSELAADVCLLIAANEGHSLQRDAVEALYLSRGNDLRATISDLNFWCQIGVGDRRGGFDWFYLRWPKGSDLDENGDVVRVVSKDTYVKGMGWIARDVITSSDEYSTELDALNQCWHHWQLQARDWPSPLDMGVINAEISSNGSKVDRIADLNAYQEFCGLLSDMDMCSKGMFGSMLQDLVDPSLPDMPSKVKEDFVCGRQLLEADPVVHHNSLMSDITTSISNLTIHHLGYHTQRKRPERHSPSQRSEEDNGQVAAARKTTDATSKEPRQYSEGRFVALLESSFRRQPTEPRKLNRHDLSLAFDPIAVPETAASSSSHLDPSVFDRTLRMIVLDVAPWVRSIVSYDQSLMHDRKRLSSLLGEGGQKKRMRSTRSALSALEGGERGSTRRERYFQGSINPILVLNTGLETWRDIARGEVEKEEMRSQPATEFTDAASE
ncbi:ATPase family associated with various cellular activities (AAA) [Geosmithia morbida]|uniref:ATPase family associated with various cellular activities (AAA) n=1 Tax=Geosmithia morbida TaxID=1094350 RepID=A0A9P4YNF0_9HYPO|nr:ATPase family associated with various cellular activities (AAA) [Geosmithia morbida]KAF4119790.1 ATPase family associated with various cellular activities (AAA) [Geosmithia morbida]